MDRKFGRLVSPDPRDRMFQVRRSRSSRVRRYWNDSAVWYDQGETSSCVGHAWAHWAANSPIVQRINPFGVYTFSQYLDEYAGEDYEGTSVRAGAKVMKALGFIAEYRWATTLQLAIDALLEQGPVVVGTNWYEGMMEPDRDGFIHPTGEVVGGHGYLWNGVDVAKRRIRVKNSYGRKWGQRGRAWLSFDDAKRLIAEDGEVCLALEQLAI